MARDDHVGWRVDPVVAARANALLQRMTLEEKIDQLHQCGIGEANPNNLAARADEFRPTYGSFILNGARADLATRNALQRRCVEESRLGIPAVFGSDVIHGYRAIFPIPLAQACAWNPARVREACRVAAQMARADGVDWTFAPMVDHCVDPRWGRIAETFGESPYASSVFGVASVEGYQGERLDASDSIAACLKHYVGYGASEGGRDYSAADVSAQRLWDMHLPPFLAGIRAGARTVMSAFNDLNGIPASAHRQMLTGILRERWGFEGVVVSDWNAVLQLLNQGFAADEAEAAEKAINAGVDLDMADGFYRRNLAALLAAGRVSTTTLEAAVRRVLQLKVELGLFERPYVERSPQTEAPPNAQQLALAETFAAESMVLLKNDDVLPIKATTRRIALIGPLAEARSALLGSWAQQGRPEETPTIAEALRKRLPAGTELDVVCGCACEGTDTNGFDAALRAAQAAELVILCVGEEAAMSGENASRASLRLPGMQEELALAATGVGQPIVLVVVSGRPIELLRIEPRVQGVVAAWQGGSRAAAALAGLLLGERNFSGRLAVTWPRTGGQIPVAHHLRPRARTGNEGAYQDVPVSPQYEFGHGSSYTTFSYGPLRLDKSEIGRGEGLTAEVEVTNTGAREGAETVFWFVRDPVASVTRPLKELKHFEKATIAAGASRMFRFKIEPARDLAFGDADGRVVVEPGEFILFAGPQSVRFTLVNR